MPITLSRKWPFVRRVESETARQSREARAEFDEVERRLYDCYGGPCPDDDDDDRMTPLDLVDEASPAVKTAKASPRARDALRRFEAAERRANALSQAPEKQDEPERFAPLRPLHSSSRY